MRRLEKGLALLIIFVLLCSTSLSAFATDNVTHLQEENQVEQESEQEATPELGIVEAPEEVEASEEVEANSTDATSDLDEEHIAELQEEIEELIEDNAIVENQLIVVTKDTEVVEEVIEENEDDTLIDTLDTDEEQLVVVETTDDLATKMAEYEANPEVEYVQPNYLYTINDNDIEDLEESYNALASVNDSNASNQWYLDTIKAYSAWDYSKTNKAIKVAIIDSGVQINHPDLAANINTSKSYDFVNKTKLSGDLYGHGTHVAGIVGAVANNGIGIAGVSYNAELLCYRVTYNYNNEETTTTSLLVSAINQAVQDGAKVINLSLGGPKSDIATQSAVTAAKNANVIVICAAGNYGNLTPVYPSDYPETISVVATNQANARASFSSYNSNKDIAAPGVSIYSTYLNSGYSNSNGTSMAAPIVSGIVAMMLTVNPNLTFNQIYNIITSTATDLGESGKDDYFGYGLINAQAAVVQARNTSGVIEATGITITSGNKTIAKGESFQISTSISPSTSTQKTITFTSSNTSVATVSNEGVVKGVKDGTATITARTSNGKTATCTITVKSSVLICTRSGTQYKLSIENSSLFTGKTVNVAVWSATGGQNDLKWFTMTKSGSTYQTTISLSTFKSLGTFKAHLYANDGGSNTFITSETFTVNRPTINTPAVTSTNANGYTITVTPNTESGLIQKVMIPVWCASNQSDIYWYTASKNSAGKYIVNVDVKNHKYNLGSYKADCYITDITGTQYFGGSRVTKAMTSTPGTLSIAETGSGSGFKVTLSGASIPGGN
ncbi:MAG: S8 family serine peptidase [Suipraeoptans sp.]